MKMLKAGAMSGVFILLAGPAVAAPLPDAVGVMIDAAAGDAA